MAKTMHTLCWVTFTWGGFLRTASLLRPGVQIPLGHTAYYASSPSVCVGQRPSPYRLRLGVPLVGLWGQARIVPVESDHRFSRIFDIQDVLLTLLALLLFTVFLWRC